jgi:parvulin-like peptidyl-prolyl isomerase
MVKEFENATRELEIGEHSGIVESQFGYHIIYRVPIDSGAVPIAYSSYGGEYTLRTLTAYSMFQSVMEGWQEQIEVTYSDAYNALNFDDAE